MDKTNERENEVVRIKKSRNLTPLLTFFALLMASASGYLLYLYFTSDLRQPYETLFLVIGSVGTAYFTVCFFNLLYQVISPKNAFLISEDGFLDLINGDTGVGFVSWANVGSVELLGNDKPYIGIRIVSVPELTEDVDKKLALHIRSRSEKGLPELVIRPFEISCPLEKALASLKDFRNRYYRNKESGDTNIIETDEKTRAIPAFDVNNEFDRIFKEKEIFSADDENEDVKTAEDSVETAKERVEETPEESTVTTEKAAAGEAPAEGKKSIDELLAELSDTIGKDRKGSDDKTDKAVNDGLEELIKLLKEKK